MCVCVCACVKVERSGLETDLEMLLGRERSELQVGESKAGGGGAVAGEGGACSPAARIP